MSLNPQWQGEACFAEGLLGLLDGKERQQAQKVGLTPLDAMTGSAEARYFGRGILPASMFLTSSCDTANPQEVLSILFDDGQNLQGTLYGSIGQVLCNEYERTDTSRRCILCFTASLDFLGSFRAILSTLQVVAVSIASNKDFPRPQPTAQGELPASNRGTNLLSSSQCSAKALSKTLSSSMLQVSPLVSTVSWQQYPKSLGMWRDKALVARTPNQQHSIRLQRLQPLC